MFNMLATLNVILRCIVDGRVLTLLGAGFHNQGFTLSINPYNW